MKKVTITARATVVYRKTITMPDDEYDDFIGADDETILLNIDEDEDIDYVDDFEVIDLS